MIGRDVPGQVRCLLLVLGMAAAGVLWTIMAGATVAADTPTPTAASIPLPTMDVLPSPEASLTSAPTAIPTVAAEATATPQSVTPTPSQPRPLSETATPVAAPTPSPTSPPINTPIPVQAGVPLTSSPLPSAAQLEEDARLRWGTRVPAAIRRWAFLIVPTAQRYGVNPNLVAAIMTMESGGDPLAWNASSDARGLMQVLHGPWDPKQNIDTGVRMLSELYAEFHSTRLVVAAYNAGPAAVIQYGGVPPYRETQDYVIVVLYLYDLYNHHHLTPKRRVQYRKTLRDLQHFPDAKKKIRRLAGAAHVAVSSVSEPTMPREACSRLGADCTAGTTVLALSRLDPFWPIANVPDPLQKVDPAEGS